MTYTSSVGIKYQGALTMQTITYIKDSNSRMKSPDFILTMDRRSGWKNGTGYGWQDSTGYVLADYAEGYPDETSKTEDDFKW